jgi:hypothetical protein
VRLALRLALHDVARDVVHARAGLNIHIRKSLQHVCE